MKYYKSLTVIPAYGRDYKSKKALLADWHNGKDFYIVTFNQRTMLFSIGDIHYLYKDGYTHIHFRYSGLTKIYAHNLVNDLEE